MAGTCLLAALCLTVSILSHITTFHLIKSIPLTMLVSSCGHSEWMYRNCPSSGSGTFLIDIRNENRLLKISHKQGTLPLFLQFLSRKIFDYLAYISKFIIHTFY